MGTIDKVGWIYIKDRKVLLARSRGKEIFYFPGGKRESGESDKETLIREIKEELNVDIVPSSIEYLETFKTVAHGREPGTYLETKYYSATHVGTPEATAEIEELAWFDSSDMGKLSEMGQLVFVWLKDKGLID